MFAFRDDQKSKADLPLTCRVRDQSLLANEVLWSLENTLMRISALLFLFTTFRYSGALGSIYGTIILTAMHGMAAIFTAVFIRRPIQASYLDIPGSCGNQTVAFVSLEIGGLLLDITIMGIPCKEVLNLSLSKRSKARILVIFCASGL